MKTFLLSLALTAVLAGCGVREITLSDGTPCAVYVAGYAGSIDCNWESKK